MEPLKQYLADNDLKKAVFARRVGMSRGFLGDLLTGRRTPGLGLAKRISDATNGAVPMSVWIECSHGATHERPSHGVQGISPKEVNA